VDTAVSRLSVAGSVACRICQLNGDETEEELERTLCHCKGSLQFAHKSCVDRWIQTQRSTSCEICKGQLTNSEEIAARLEAEQNNGTIMDRVTNRVLMNMGMTNAHLTSDEIQQIRHLIAHRIQISFLNVSVCLLTIAIVITCYVVVMTSHLAFGLPLLCVLVLITVACKERLNHLEMQQ